MAGENSHVQSLVQWIPIIEHVWDKMLESQAPPLQRSTAGPVREFDYNLDGLAHYGMLPDMLQDLKNVLLPHGDPGQRCSCPRRSTSRSGNAA